jgi:hypothetical protein
MVSTTGTSEKTPAQVLAGAKEQQAEAKTAVDKAEKAYQTARHLVPPLPDAEFDELAAERQDTIATLELADGKVTRAQWTIDNAAKIAKQADIAKLTDEIQTAIKGAVGGHKASMDSLQVTGFVATVTTAESGAREVNVRATGEGVLSAKMPRKSGGNGNGTRAPRATIGDGRSWRDVAAEAGLDTSTHSDYHKMVFHRAQAVHDKVPHENCQYR